MNRLKSRVRESGLPVDALVRTAWAAAASYRGTDMRGGVNGARLALAPQKDWAVNDPAEGRPRAGHAAADPRGLQ